MPQDLFTEQQRQINELSARLEQVLREKMAMQEQTTVLQKMVEMKEMKIEQLTTGTEAHKQDVALEEYVDATWEFVMELMKVRPQLCVTIEDVRAMINAMLAFKSPDIAFMRKVKPIRGF